MSSASYCKNDVGELALTYDLTDTIGYPLQVSINSWHSARPLYWSSHVGSEELAHSEFLESPGLPLVAILDQHGRSLLDFIPEQIACLSKTMAGLQYEVLQSCAVSQGALELAEDCPLLLLLVVNQTRLDELSETEFERLVGQSRQGLLSYVGLPSSKSLAKLIRRIAVASVETWEIEALMSVLGNPANVDLLRHCSAPHMNHLRLLRRHQYPLWPALLDLVDESTSHGDLDWLHRMLQDVLRLANDDPNRLKRIRTWEQLQLLHDRLVDRFNEEQQRLQETNVAQQEYELSQQYGAYPEAPLADASGIQAIRSWHELIREGIEMRHCVGTYGPRVGAGLISIYRMQEPERLTISLVKRGNRWVLDEIRGKCNALPTQEASLRVHAWADAMKPKRG